MAELKGQEDYISQAVTLSSETIFNFYTKLCQASITQIDITDTELIQNLQKLGSLIKSLVYGHSVLCDHAKLETVRAAVKTLNGIRDYFQEQAQSDISQNMQQECLNTLLDYLKHTVQTEQLNLFDE